MLFMLFSHEVDSMMSTSGSTPVSEEQKSEVNRNWKEEDYKNHYLGNIYCVIVSA